jgi:hypothetical protein
MADTATFSAAMKTKFIGPIRDHLPKGKVLLFGDPDANPTDFKGILPNAEGIDFVGNEFRIPLKAERNQSVGFRSENESLPAPGSSKYTYLQEPMRYAYALFNITGQLLKASEKSEGAFRAAFKAEMEDTTLASKLDHNRAAHGDGTGVVATVRNNEAAAQTVIDVDTTINLRGGEILDGVTIATGVVIEPARRVVSVDRANRQITVSPALTTGLTATTDGWVRASSDSTVAVPNNSWNKEIQGLKAIVDSTGTLHGINPTSYPFWASYESAVGGAISDAVLRTAKDEVGFEQGLDVDDGGLDYALLTTRGIRRRYADTLTALKRFNDASSVTLHGGFKAIMFDENPIFVDDQTPVSTVYGLALNRLFWSQMSDWDWMEEDGKVLKWESRRDRYIAVLYKYCQLGTTHRGAHFKLTGVTDDVK